MAVTQDKPKEVKDGKGKKKDEEKEPELSEEDQQLKSNLELMVERTCEPDTGVQKLAINSMINEIRTATATMTSVPKPLKFLAPHVEKLKLRCEELPVGSENRQLLADVVSVLSTTVGAKEGVRDALKFRLQGSKMNMDIWGHEYMRHLAGEISEEFRVRREADPPQSVADLLELVEQIVPHHMTHNAEPEAVDLLLEVERLDLLPRYVDDKNYSRTCMYLVSCCHYLPEPEDTTVLETAHAIYSKMGKYHDALRVALHINKRETIESTFAACTDFLEKKQLCYLLARHGYRLDLEDGVCAVSDDTEREALREIISNSRLAEYYLSLARDLDVMEPKLPEDVYKSHLTEGNQPAAVDSARANLASSFVNGLVNAGFGTDKLMTVTPEGSGQVHWIFKNKDHGKTSATASLGLITLWDVEGGLPQIDKYLYSTDNYVVAGALLAIGIVNCGVQNENDPAFALVSDYVNNLDQTIKCGAILGLGLAYAGSQREEVAELLSPLVSDAEVSMEVAGLAGLALGLVFTSSAKDDIVMALLQALMLRSDVELQGPAAKQLILGLGLMFLGKQELVEATLEVCKTLDEHISPFAQTLLQACAYAGTGNVLIVQQFLAACGQHIEAATEEGKSWMAVHQGAAVLGLAMVAMAEPLGISMAGRSLEHLLQYGDPPVRRAVPLALALLNVSKPDINAMDTLSRLSHDADSEVAQSAILALGIIGAGTNNSRLAGLLRSLVSYYLKDPAALFLVRVAQGLVHMGKGLLSVTPYHTDRQLLSGMALSGLLAVLVSGLDIKTTINGKYPHLLYCLATAMNPRMLMTLDTEGKMLPVACRVGTAVDVVAQAGKPKTITGFQTHNTPVLLSAGERAELGTDKYIPISPILEGVVILKKNPDYMEE